MGGRICRMSCWRRCWRRLGGRRVVLSDLRHGAAGVRWMEGRTRCAGDAAGAETADHRRGHGHAGATLPCVGVAGGQAGEPRERVDRRGAASSEQPPCTHLYRPQLLPQGDGSWRAGARSTTAAPGGWSIIPRSCLTIAPQPAHENPSRIPPSSPCPTQRTHAIGARGGNTALSTRVRLKFGIS
jgi:hypothetical protein